MHDSTVRKRKFRRQRKASGMKAFEIWLDRPAVERITQLRQPGESFSDVVSRALAALQAQDTPGAAPRAGDAMSAEERKAAVLPRLRAMHAQGLTLQEMVDQLYAEGVRTPTGKARFQKGTLGNWLASG
jgi:hypothetical protein